MPLDTEAIVAIQQLYAAYCHTLDDGDGDAFSACFTPDGTLGGAGGTIVGAEGLAQFATKLLASGRNLRHVASGIYVVGDGDEAEGRAYLLAYHGGTSTELLASGRYRDRLRRVDGTWRFAERVFIPDA
jgi:hypothetical protein